MSETLQPQSNSTWAIIGKFLVGTITVLTGAILIYQFVYQKEEKLSATGVHTFFYLPKKMQDDLFREQKPPKEAIFNLLEKQLSNSNNKQLIELTENLSEVFNKHNEPIYSHLRQLKQFKGYTNLLISNNGLKQAEKVSLEFTGSGVYEIKDGDNKSLNFFSNSIPLGDIRPQVTTEVDIWTIKTYSKFDKTLVTHTNGAEHIEFPQDQSTSFTFISLIPYIIVALVCFLLGALLEGATTKTKETLEAEKSKKEKEEETKKEEIKADEETPYAPAESEKQNKSE